MKLSREWFSAAEIAALQLPAMPTTKANVLAMADRNNWRRADLRGRSWRERQGRGAGYEYHYTLFPSEAQLRLLAQFIVPDEVAPEPDTTDPFHVEIWRQFDRMPDRKKDVARERMRALMTLQAHATNGIPRTVAVAQVAAEFKVRPATLYDWEAKVRDIPRCYWLAYLVSHHAGRPDAAAECSPEAWDFIRSDYLRPEAPAFSDCFRRLEKTAAVQGWTIPSARTLERRMQKISPVTQRLAREGVDAAKRMYPAQIRSRVHLHPLEAVNADAHTWDVFVRWEDGTIGRPVMVAFQDLYSGMLLSWRVDRASNSEAIRLAFGDMVEEYGIPGKCYLDNGRDFASKKITGGTPNRYRYKVRDDELTGVITQFGVEVHWTTPYSGQSKPIERFFGDLAHGGAKHPKFAGAYVGHKPDAKPENYGSTAVPIDVFIATAAEIIAELNMRPGRKGFVCGGVKSYLQAFSERLEEAEIRKASLDQARIWLLPAEPVTLNKIDQSVRLFGNRYYEDFLGRQRTRKVVVRYDPAALHAPLHVYLLDGTYLGSAPCTEAVGFDDVSAAHEHSRKRKTWLRLNKAVLEAERGMTIKQIAEMLPEPDAAPPLPETKVVRLVRGNTALAPMPEQVEDDLAWLAESNAALRAQRGLHVVRDDKEGNDNG